MNESIHNQSVDPELEARIVALVLGEASDLEQDQLRGLIEKRPELAAIQAKYETVHGLLREVGTGEDVVVDEDWKLTADKRKQVLSVIRGETPAPSVNDSVTTVASISNQSKMRPYWSLARIAAAFCGAGVLGLVVIAMLLPAVTKSRETSRVAFSSGRSPDSIEVAAALLEESMDAEFAAEGFEQDMDAYVAENGVAERVFKGSFESASPSPAPEPDYAASSKSALSRIQASLGAETSLPSPYDLQDDVQYFDRNYDFKTPGQSNTVGQAGAADKSVSDVSDRLKRETLNFENERRSTRSERRVDPKGEAYTVEVPYTESKVQQYSVQPPTSEVTGSVIHSDALGLERSLDEVGELQDEEVSPSRRKGRQPSSRRFDDSGAARQLAEGESRGQAGGGAMGGGGRQSGQQSGQGQPQQGQPQSGESVPMSGGTNYRFYMELGRPGQSGKESAAKDVDGNGDGAADSVWIDSGVVLRNEQFGVVTRDQNTTWMAPGLPEVEPKSESLELALPGQSSSLDTIVEFDMDLPMEAEDLDEFEFGMGMGGKVVEQKSKASPVDHFFSDMPEPPPTPAPASQPEPAAERLNRKSTLGNELSDLFGDSEPDTMTPQSGRLLKREAKLADGTVRQQLGEPRFGATKQDLGRGIEEPADRYLSLGKNPKVKPPTANKPSEPAILGDFAVDPAQVSDLHEKVSELREKAQTGFDSAQSSVKALSQSKREAKTRAVVPLAIAKSKAKKSVPAKRPLPARQPVPTRQPVPSAGLKELKASDEAFSTFSLHVSDVSFKLAQAALSRGEWPEAAKIRIEEFVNAFDYGDPMPRENEKVACRVEQSIHPFLQQRNLVRVSMRTAAAGRASSTPLRLTLLLDNSGSMERIDRQQTVRRAFALLASQLKSMDQVTLISFARQPRLLADKVSGSKAGELVRMIDKLPSEGGTNIEAALQLAFEKAQEQQVDGAQNRVILLTDGAVNLGNANPTSLSQMITRMRDAGIAFDAAGISAEGLNDEVLEALTRKGDGRYYLLDSIEDADDGFAQQIAGALRPSAKNVKVQVEFNPKRVGRYKLLGFEKHRLKKEDFRNDKVDAAEMAAAEAGVAIYQVEAKADGEGDIGSVSVRFRDLSTGQMIENRWPIPYESDAQRPERAAASMRVATTAAMFAAKLKGDPLGETVQLKTLSDLITELPEQARSVKRVQQLQQMIQQARQLSGE